MTTTEDVLEHYGIKGMRWGVRRSRQQIDSDSADVTAKKSAQAKIAAKKTTDVLSNQELAALNNRLNLEANYRQLTTKEKAAAPQSAMSKGGKWAGNFAKDVANQQAKNAANAFVKTMIDSKIAEVTKPKPTLEDKLSPYSAKKKK
jgi:hypothetical protein